MEDFIMINREKHYTNIKYKYKYKRERLNWKNKFSSCTILIYLQIQRVL